MGSLLEKRLVVDFSHVIFRNFFMNRKQIDSLDAENPGSGFHFLKYCALQSLFYIVTNFNPTEVILAIDGRKNWRKKYYPEYKADRKEKRAKDTFDWFAFFDRLSLFEEEIKKNFPFKVIKNAHLEADDIAGWFARERNDIETILVSSDKDWSQLLKYPNIKMWDPIKRSLLKVKNPEEELRIKILTGDSGDNVPPIRRGMGPKTAKKILSNEEKYKKELNDHKEEFKRNTVLIDLKFTPKQFLSKLAESYDSYEFPMKDLKHLYIYFSKSKMKRFCDKLDSISKILNSINF